MFEQQGVLERTDLSIVADHNGHNDSVDGNGFAENDTDQVLGFDSRCFHSAPEDADPSRVDAPVTRRFSHQRYVNMNTET